MPFLIAHALWDVAIEPPAVVAETRAATPPDTAPPSFGPPIAHALVQLTAQRLVEAYLYPTPFAESPSTWGPHYREAFTKRPLFDASKPAFAWDGDSWKLNVVGHGLMGSELYIRARSCRFGALGSLAFAAAGTALWEYGFEANGVRPSAQDLVYTPLAGLALGEARYQLHRVAGGIASPGLRGVVRAVVDPFGELSRGTGLFDC